MEIMDFLCEYGDRLVIAVFSLVAFIVTLVKTRSLKHALSAIKEVDDMKLKTVRYNGDASTVSAQHFENLQTDYTLDRVTNSLKEKDEKIDLQAQINSVRPSTLDELLDRLLPVVDETLRTAQSDYRTLSDDLYEMGKAFEAAEFYRDRLGLSDDLSFIQVMEAVQAKGQELGRRIDDLQKVKQGGVEHESKTETAESQE